MSDRKTMYGENVRRAIEAMRFAHDFTAKAATTPGDHMPDGTIFGGISPESGEPMYVTPADVPLTLKWKQAMEYAAQLDAYGHQDWRVPTKGELNVLYNNRAAVGGFDESGSWPGGWYWSSGRFNDSGPWGQRFSDGTQGNYYELDASSLRCVR